MGCLKGIVDWKYSDLISLSIQENILTSITANRKRGLSNVIYWSSPMREDDYKLY